MSYGFAITKPTNSDCMRCIDTADNFGGEPECNLCGKKQRVEILQFVKTFFGVTAICKDKDGSFIEVNITDLQTFTPQEEKEFAPITYHIMK